MAKSRLAKKMLKMLGKKIMKNKGLSKPEMKGKMLGGGSGELGGFGSSPSGKKFFWDKGMKNMRSKNPNEMNLQKVGSVEAEHMKKYLKSTKRKKDFRY